MNYERFETDEAVKAAAALAAAEWAAAAPDNQALAMQTQLMGIPDPGEVGTPLDESLALDIIQSMGDTFEAGHPEQATEGLGAVLVGVARLAASHELAVGPVLDLGRVLTQRGDAVAVHAPARLARACRERSLAVGDDARRCRMVGALALCVAKGLDDVELLHELQIKPRELLDVIGRETFARLSEPTLQVS